MPVRVEYAEYLKSPYWRAIRRQALAVLGHRCNRCGSLDQLQVHHKTYARLGCERVPDDLEVLCDACHSTHHGFTAPESHSGPEHISTILARVTQKIVAPRVA